jgi:hypothetical protein
MPTEPDLDYFILQAKLHRQQADLATDPEVRRVNDELANRFSARVALMTFTRAIPERRRR